MTTDALACPRPRPPRDRKRPRGPGRSRAAVQPLARYQSDPSKRQPCAHCGAQPPLARRLRARSRAIRASSPHRVQGSERRQAPKESARPSH
eukprot:scaffold87304_cov66-Phaeocystis_antarctica.AAC.2